MITQNSSLYQLLHTTPNPDKINRMVENRLIYSSEEAELNIYETFEEATQVPLTFSHTSVIGMLQGKKTMHFRHQMPFAFLPQETIVVAAHEPMKIDFPEASLENPTRCLALLIADSLIQNCKQLFQEHTLAEENQQTFLKEKLPFSVVKNDLVDKNIQHLVHLFIEPHQQAKPIFIEYGLKELIIRLLQNEASHILLQQADQYQADHRLASVAHYIQKHIEDDISIDTLCEKACMSKANFYKYFKNTFGISPSLYILQQKIKKAQFLLRTTQKSISEIGYSLSFNSIHYFDRVFKKITGTSPKIYKKQTSST